MSTLPAPEAPSPTAGPTVVVRTVPLDPKAVNEVLDQLDAHRAPLRTVIVP